MHVLVTGGAGFLGSHLSDRLIADGHRVTAVDNFSTGRPANIAHLLGHPAYAFVRADVTTPWVVEGKIDAVAHLASPASPPDYHRMPLQTLAVGSRGTENALQLAHEHSARFVLASTSEIYGDPLVHPQVEDYFGNVNPVGPRSVYDEAKRYAEAVTSAYRRTYDVDAGIVRIFNTYGPRMRPQDGRVVSSFITQALLGEPLTIYGSGEQTRSFCYVDDLVGGLAAMLTCDEAGPVNIGNPDERTVNELAELVLELTASDSGIERYPLPVDDPTRRQPDISVAKSVLGWKPEVDVRIGLRATIDDFALRRAELESARASLRGAQPTGKVA